jgi:hypothetical protein
VRSQACAGSLTPPPPGPAGRGRADPSLTARSRLPLLSHVGRRRYVGDYLRQQRLTNEAKYSLGETGVSELQRTSSQPLSRETQAAPRQTLRERVATAILEAGSARAG